jgi:hypothetical protein
MSLDQAVFRKGEATGLSDDEVVQYPHIHERQGILQAPGNGFVRLAGLHDAGRVVVGQDHRRRIVSQGLSRDLLDVYGGAIRRAAKELLEGNQPVTVVEVEAAEHLVGAVS